MSDLCEKLRRDAEEALGEARREIRALQTALRAAQAPVLLKAIERALKQSAEGVPRSIWATEPENALFDSEATP